MLFLGLSWPSLAQDKDLWKLLRGFFNLSPSYRAGERNFYHMRTVYLDFGGGKISQTQVFDGYYAREVVKADQGKHTDRFVWKFVKKGMAKGAAEVKDFEVLPFTKNFVYEFADWTPQQFPIDRSAIPKTFDGWYFFVKLIDAHTFDVVVDGAAQQGKLAHVGESLSLPVEGIPVGVDFPPLFTDSQFTNAPFDVTFRGITSSQDEPCAILTFRSDDCRVHLVANISGMKLPTDGVSCYQGEIFLSLITRKIFWAHFIEYVESLTTLSTPAATPMKQLVRREITLEKLDKLAYEQAGR